MPITVSPDPVEIYGGNFGGVADPRSDPGATGALGDDSDSTFAVAYGYDIGGGSQRYDTAAAHFVTPTGTGGFSAAQVTPRLRVQLGDDGASPGDTRMKVIAYPTDFSTGFSVSWLASLPDHSAIYDEGLPIDPSLTLGTDHWWTFDDGGGAADPWPDITDLLAAGNLTFEFLRDVNPVTRPWSDGFVKVFEFTLTIPGGGFPPRRGGPRHQATTAARGVGGRDDIQTGPRGIGAVV